jgi:Flp pilus assembly protein TadG
MTFKKYVTKFQKNDQGVAAIEFAIIVPVMLTLFFGVLEIGSGIDMNKRIARSASTTGDNLAKTTTKDLKLADIESILKVAKSEMQPFNDVYQPTDKLPTMMVTAIYTDPAGNSTVSWSRQLSRDDTYSAVTSPTATIPSTIKIKDSTLFKVEVTINYKTVTSWIIQPIANGQYGNITMNETYYFAPREIKGKITCSDPRRADGICPS